MSASPMPKSAHLLWNSELSSDPLLSVSMPLNIATASGLAVAAAPACFDWKSAFALAIWSSSARNASTSRFCAASSAVLPSLFRLAASAPAPTSSRAHSSWPHLAARCRAVSPSLSAACTFRAPFVL